MRRVRHVHLRGDTHDKMSELGSPFFWAEIARNAWRIEIERLSRKIESNVLEVYDARPEGWFPGMRCAVHRRELRRRTGIDEATISAIWARKSHRDILDRLRPLPERRAHG